MEIERPNVRGPKQEREVFIGRLHALAHAHEALTVGEWDRASVQELVQRSLAPFEAERFIVQGPEASLDGNNALHLTMALHELATNAVKYGALCNDEGKVEVSWSIASDRVVLAWGRRTGQPSRRQSAKDSAPC